MWHMGDGWGWLMGFGSIWIIGFWAVIIWAVLTLRARWSGEPGRSSQDAGTALEILERRYARGELNDEQYEVMRTRLSRPPEPKAA
jgi:putative membrane protein